MRIALKRDGQEPAEMSDPDKIEIKRGGEVCC